MARDYVCIGCTPAEETCSQVGTDDYPHQSYKECRAYVHQLRRMFGPEPEEASIAVKSFPHDFGTYREVVVWYDDRDEASTEYAYRVERESPAQWDREAEMELGIVRG